YPRPERRAAAAVLSPNVLDAVCADGNRTHLVREIFRRKCQVLGLASTRASFARRLCLDHSLRVALRRDRFVSGNSAGGGLCIWCPQHPERPEKNGAGCLCTSECLAAVDS